MLSFLVNRASLALGRVAGPPASARLPEALRPLHSLKNGFRALDDALLVLPAESVGSLPGVRTWNAEDGWRRWFDLDARVSFFAMDVVLRQFGVDGEGRVVRFDAVTERLEVFADDFDAWAARMIAGGAAQDLARAWQVMHRPLNVEERLAPSALGRGLTPMHLADAMEVLGERADVEPSISREIEVFDVAW